MLSPQQVTMYQGQALRARSGDAQAQHFFSEIRREQMPDWQEIVGIYDALAGAAGQAAAQAFAGVSPPYAGGAPAGPPAVGQAGASQADGILDAAFLQRMQLGDQQLKDFRRMTLLYAQGDADAITFFNGCAGGALAGSVYSSRALQVRDKILCSPRFGWRKVGNGIEPPAVPMEEAPFEVTHAPEPPTNEAVATAAFAQVYAPQPQPTAAQGGAPSGPASRRAALDAIAQRDRLEAEQRAAKMGGAAVQAQPPQPYAAPPQAYAAPPQAYAVPHAAPHVAAAPAAVPAQVLISSNVVVRVPTFDVPGAIETIQTAIDDKRIFSADAVQVLLREIVHLRSRVAQSQPTRSAPAPAAAPVPVAAPAPVAAPIAVAAVEAAAPPMNGTPSATA